MNGKETVFEAVLEEIEKVYPQIVAVLRQKYPELNETETKVCLLSCTNLSNAEMAEILGISKHTVDKNRSKLRDKMNLSPERMNDQLHQVLSHWLYFPNASFKNGALGRFFASIICVWAIKTLYHLFLFSLCINELTFSFQEIIVHGENDARPQAQLRQIQHSEYAGKKAADA